MIKRYMVILLQLTLDVERIWDLEVSDRATQIPCNKNDTWTWYGGAGVKKS